LVPLCLLDWLCALTFTCLSWDNYFEIEFYFQSSDMLFLTHEAKWNYVHFKFSMLSLSTIYALTKLIEIT